MWFNRKESASSTADPVPEEEKPAPPSAAMRNINRYSRELTAEEIGKGDHRGAVGGMWDEIGQLQIDFLKSRGLQPGHKMCDVGCGALRGGIHFVRYLDAGNYYGLDINASLLEAGRLEVKTAGLEAKAPNLLVDDKFQMSRFGVQFDYMLAVSVFTHLFANHIVRCLTEARAALAPGGQFLATFFEAPDLAHLQPIKHEPGGIVTNYDADPFHYAVEEMRTYARIAGMNTEVIGDWKHPRSQRMLAFTLATPD
jgi:SAM-dependent methyltransferase